MPALQSVLRMLFWELGHHAHLLKAIGRRGMSAKEKGLYRFSLLSTHPVTLLYCFGALTGEHTATPMKKLTLLYALIFGLTGVAEKAKGEYLTYSLSGGTITGSLNGVSFSNATWSIFTTANTASVQYIGVGGYVYAPVYYIPVTPVINIVDGARIFSATMTGWDLESRDYRGNSTDPNDASSIIFSNYLADGKSGVEQGLGGYIGGTSANYIPLNSKGSFIGYSDFDNSTFSTSAGLLQITSSTSGAGAFTITAPIPEPSTYALFGIGAIGLLMVIRRKKAV